MNEVVLKADNLQTYIGHHHILQGLSFEAQADAVTVLIGRNGAGKSTTLKTLIGLLPPSEGTIVFNGMSIQGKRPYEIARMGIGYVPEDMGIFADLTVEENFKVAKLKEDEATAGRLARILDLFGALGKFWHSPAGNLSGGQKQMLAIGRAIVNDISLLLIDEPSKGLAPIIIEALIEAINLIKEECVVVLVEQNFYMASAVGDYFHILDDGRIVHSGRMEALVDDEELKSRYLGISKSKS
ncbi:ABC transporter related [Desulfatibacillum aliphaticivorans]|uniref:ABC transporter related n=1 Tax=Desulfatibacillum aliphaticivorans TaxID=218208 RepID=B8FD10_DESAL|nr:ABC transporter ATP-binding protein [Desulfatibacillum aliphaticivorans]ACL06441.1 ABC transporter related [Desulfatibacillum aliphaticivorans]